MFNLPYIIPEDELELNLTLVLMIVNKLNSTSTGKLVLDNERLTIYFYLVKNPHILNKLLISLSKSNIQLKSYELASFKAENLDIDTLYDNGNIKQYLQILITKELIEIKYNNKVGFVYVPTSQAKEIIEKLNNKYLTRVSTFINKLGQVSSTQVSKINTNLKKILNKDN